MLHFYSSANDIVDPKVAAQEAVKEAILENDPKNCRLIIFHSSIGHDFKELANAFKRKCPNAIVVGSSAAGVIGTHFVSEKIRTLGVMCIFGDPNEIAVVMKPNLTHKNCAEVTRAAAEELYAANKNINMVYILSSFLGTVADTVIEQTEAVFGKDVTILGGTTGDNMHALTSIEVLNKEITHSSIIMVGFADPTLSAYGISHHGCTPTNISFTVTKANNNEVLELNNEPSWEYFCKKLSMDPSKSIGIETLPFTSLGLELPQDLAKAYDSQYVLCTITARDKDAGNFYCSTSVQNGDTLTLLERNEDRIFTGIDVITAKLLETKKDKKIVAAFHFDCAARGRFMFDRVLKEEMILKLQSPLMTDGDFPWLGMFGFGEYAKIGDKNSSHTYTTTVTILMRSEAS